MNKAIWSFVLLALLSLELKADLQSGSSIRTERREHPSILSR